MGQCGAPATADLTTEDVLAAAGRVGVAADVDRGGFTEGLTTGVAVGGAGCPLYEGRTLPSGPIDWATHLADVSIPKLKASTTRVRFMDYPPQIGSKFTTGRRE